MKSSKTTKKSIFVVLLLIVIGYLLLSPLVSAPLYGNLIFYPDYPIRYDPNEYKVTHLQGIAKQDLYITCANGNKLNAWLFRQPKSPYLVIINHGNASNISNRVALVDDLLQLGVSVLLYDYQGYGLSQGAPTIGNICDDGDTVYGYACHELNYEPKNIVEYGESLGCAVACNVARTHPCAGIILQSGFTSLKEIAAEKFAIFNAYPDFLFPQPHLDNAAYLQIRRIPLLVVHGALDETISVSHANYNFKCASEPKTLVVLPNSGHYIAEEDHRAFMDCLNTFLSQFKKGGVGEAYAPPTGSPREKPSN